MAIKKYRLSKRNSDNTYDVVHIETSADMVMTADNKTVETALSLINSALEILKGTGDGSVTKQVADGIASIVAGSPASFDTLKELSDWISTHENDASAMNSRITALEGRIVKSTTDIGVNATMADGVEYYFVYE